MGANQKNKASNVYKSKAVLPKKEVKATVISGPRKTKEVEVEIIKNSTILSSPSFEGDNVVSQTKSKSIYDNRTFFDTSTRPKRQSRRLQYYENATCELLSEDNENSDDSEDDTMQCRRKIKERGYLYSPQKSVNITMSVETISPRNQIKETLDSSSSQKMNSSTARKERQKLRESQLKQMAKEREEAEVA